jgi:hypothetical protein
MKALGIPNNKDFYEVTKIDDALSLWKNIQVIDLCRNICVYACCAAVRHAGCVCCAVA